MRFQTCFTIVIIACLTRFHDASALEMPDYLASTPIGSWVTMEETITRGKKVEVVEVSRSLVGQEVVDGRRHFWIEIKTQAYKVSKKGKRKPKGDPGLVKILADARVFGGNVANIMGNIQNLASRMYVKNDDKVMDMSGGGALADAMLKATGAAIDFKMTDLGESRDIDTPIGKVSAHLYKGVGDASVKILFKKIETHNETRMWLSDEVPFGLVETEGVTIVNGKEEYASGRIIAAGMSGAKSEIDISKAEASPFDALRKLGKPQ